MALEILNAEDLRDAIKKTINGKNNLSPTAIQNSITAFLDRTGLINESLEILKNELQCTVCIELPLSACSTKCQHIFCNYCLNMSRMINTKQCPICRTDLLERELDQKRLFKIDKIIDAVMLKRNPTYHSWKIEQLLERYSKLNTLELNKLLCSTVLNSSMDIQEREELKYVAPKLLSLSQELQCSRTNLISFHKKKRELMEYISKSTRIERLLHIL